LEDLRDRFLRTYGHAAQTAVAFEYNTEFSKVLESRMKYYSTDPSADAINRIKGEVDVVKSIMCDNIEKVMTAYFLLPYRRLLNNHNP
jgi:vesicle-associated membrane protein 7